LGKTLSYWGHARGVGGEMGSDDAEMDMAYWGGLVFLLAISAFCGEIPRLRWNREVRFCMRSLHFRYPYIDRYLEP